MKMKMRRKVIATAVAIPMTVAARREERGEVGKERKGGEGVRGRIKVTVSETRVKVTKEASVLTVPNEVGRFGSRIQCDHSRLGGFIHSPVVQFSSSLLS